MRDMSSALEGVMCTVLPRAPAFLARLGELPEAAVSRRRGKGMRDPGQSEEQVGQGLGSPPSLPQMPNAAPLNAITHLCFRVTDGRRGSCFALWIMCLELQHKPPAVVP